MHLAFLLRNAFAFPSLKVVSHVEKKKRERYFLWDSPRLPSLSRFHFHASFTRRGYLPLHFSTIKNTRLSTIDPSKRLFGFRFFRFDGWNKPSRGFRVRGSYRRFKKRYPLVENFIVLESGADRMKADPTRALRSAIIC